MKRTNFNDWVAMVENEENERVTCEKMTRSKIRRLWIFRQYRIAIQWKKREKKKENGIARQK